MDRGDSSLLYRLFLEFRAIGTRTFRRLNDDLDDCNHPSRQLGGQARRISRAIMADFDFAIRIPDRGWSRLGRAIALGSGGFRPACAWTCLVLFSFTCVLDVL